MTVVINENQQGSACNCSGRLLNVLFAMFQGGGNIALIMPIVAAAVQRGHTVRVLAGPGVWPSRTPVSALFRERIRLAGATSISFAEPATHPLDALPHPKGFLFGAPPPPLPPLTCPPSPNRPPNPPPPNL